jgi:3-ketoacyl-CoA synthase
MFDVVRRVLEQTKLKPKNIDVLIVNCSLFSPTPSLCAMIINEFKMRQDILTYNLSGMGCSAGLISIDLAKNILAGRPNTNVLVVSTEIITPNLYLGNERSFLLQNILFRCGGAAVVLSNKWTDAFRAKFKLLHVVRTQYVSEDSAGCVYETQDENLVRGVRLSKDLVKVAGRAMEKNFTMLGPYVLPISEQAKTVFWMIARELFKRCNGLGIKLPKISPYIPDFKRGIDYFCIHAGKRFAILPSALPFFSD